METSLKIKTTPRDFFTYLGVFVTLYISAVSLVRLFFEIINTLLPDILYFNDGFSSGTLRWSIASLFVMFPVYIILSYLVNKDLKTNPTKKDVGIRKWLTFLTLFIAGLTLAISLIVLINQFLGGEISSRFMYKVLAIFIVAGTIFYYYIFDLRRNVAIIDQKVKFFALGSVSSIIIIVIFGFVVMGTPGSQRNARLDEQRIGALQSLQWQVLQHWQRKNVLPTTLDDLNDSISGFSVPFDPVDKTPYEFNVLNEYSFELCANFASASPGFTNLPLRAPTYSPKIGMESDSWAHSSGRHCFKRVIDPDIYGIDALTKPR